MTTTHIYQGMEGTKPSSRVLAAPGGGSSFSLGHEENPAPQQRRQQPAAAPTQAAVSSEPANIESAQRARPQRSAVNPITGEPLYPTKTESPSATATAAKPEEEEADSAPQQAAVGAPAGKPSTGEVTSTRVSQPPGGACHKLW